MRYPQFTVALTPGLDIRVTALPPRDASGVMSVAVHQSDGTLQLLGTAEDLLAIAAGIKDAVHLEEIVQLGQAAATEVRS